MLRSCCRWCCCCCSCCRCGSASALISFYKRNQRFRSSSLVKHDLSSLLACGASASPSRSRTCWLPPPGAVMNSAMLSRTARVAARAARHRILAQSNSGPSSERIHQGLRHHSTRFFGTADFSSSRLSVSTTLITVTFSRCVFFLFWHFTDLFCAQANCTSKKQSYLELTSFLGFVLLSTSIRTGSSCSDFRPRSPCARFRLF